MGRNAERACDDLDIVDRDIALTALHRTDIRAMQSGKLGQGLLAEAPDDSEPAHVGRKGRTR